MSDQFLPWYRLRLEFLLLLLVYVLAGLVLLAVPVLAAGWYYHIPEGEGAAGPAVPEAPFQQVWHEGPVLLVGMGDSVTTGFGARHGHGYFERLVRSPKDDPADIRDKDLSRVFPELQAYNLAANSTSSFDHAEFQLNLLPARPTEMRGIIVVTTGGIDLIHNYGETPPREEAIYGATYEQGVEFGRRFRAHLDKLLDGLAARFPAGCDVFIATIYDPTDGVGDIENVHPLLRMVRKLPPWPDGLRLLDLYNSHIREAAAARPFVHLVDVHALMLGHGIHCRDEDNPHYDPEDPHYWYFWNLEDPNERGYDAIRRAFLNEMIKVFRKSS